MKKAILSLLVLAVMVLGTVPVSAQIENSYKKGLRSYYTGDYKEAVRILKEYVRHRPDPRAYYLIGYALYELGRYDEAARYFKEAYLIDPEISIEKLK